MIGNSDETARARAISDRRGIHRPISRSILGQMAEIAAAELTGQISMLEAVVKIRLLEATHKIKLDEEIRKLGLDVPGGKIDLVDVDRGGQL